MTEAPEDLKFYREATMRAVRERLEDEVMSWKGVVRDPMMGVLTYGRGRKFFAFLVTGGLVITKLPEPDREALFRRKGAKPFEMSGRTTKKWVQLPVRKPTDLEPFLPYVRKSYEASK